MRFLLLVFILLSVNFSFAQSLEDKYLHYRTDYYWDSTVYRSEKSFYLELNNGFITKSDYPVLHYLFTTLINDSSTRMKDSFARQDYSYYPYKYVRKGKEILMEFRDKKSGKKRLHKEYSLSEKDSIPLIRKESLDDPTGIAEDGFSVFSGKEIVQLNQKEFTTYRFTQVYDNFSSHPSYTTEDIFLDSATLIPVKFKVTLYHYTSKEKKLYSYQTILNASSMLMHDYTKMKVKDLVLFEDKNVQWTAKQKEIFLAQFPADKKKYGECLLLKADGHVSFYNYERNDYFRHVVISNQCD